MKAYRFLFGLAAAYSAAIGLWAWLGAESFFRVFRLDPASHPSYWANLVLASGPYAFVYAYAAWRPERGSRLALLALLVKIAQPIGWLTALVSGTLATRSFGLILVNDLIWWFPFLAYLVRARADRRTLLTAAAVAVHSVACLLLLASRDGLEFVADMAARARWVAGHPATWAATWSCWSLASMSLVAFTWAWLAQLVESGASRSWTWAGALLVTAGLGFDLVGETTYLVRASAPGTTAPEFAAIAWRYAILSAGWANGLYCVGGLLLSLLAWRARSLRGWLAWLGFVMWVTGLAMSLAVALHLDRAMIATGAVVMALFIPWCALVGWRMRGATHRRAS